MIISNIKKYNKKEINDHKYSQQKNLIETYGFLKRILIVI